MGIDCDVFLNLAGVLVDRQTGLLYCFSPLIDLDNCTGQMTKANDQSNSFQVARFEDCLNGTEGKILLGAFKSIAQIGISATTIRSIAKIAGLNPGVVHYYFKSKDELLCRVLEILMNNIVSNMESLLAADLPPRTKLDAFFNAGLSLFRERADEWRVLTSYWAHSISENNSTLTVHQKLNRRLRTAVVKILDEMIGDSLGQSKDVALLCFGAMEGMAFQYVLDPKQLNPEGSVEVLKGLLYNACPILQQTQLRAAAVSHV